MSYQKHSIALSLLLVLIGCSGQAPQEQAAAKKTPTTTIKTAPIKTDLIKVMPALEQSKMMVRASADSMMFAGLPAPHPMILEREIYSINSENYQHLSQNPIKIVQEQPVSTFSIDVDTGSYSNMRRMINQGILPPKDAIRLEELINYFDYNYQPPTSLEQPFSIHTELMTSPWNSDRKLLKIGLKGYQIRPDQMGNANLVFLLDVSGSMNQADKLPLLKKSLMMLTAQLNKNDRVSIVVYAGAAGVVLKPTPGNNHFTINTALNNLRAGGSTDGSQGIELAYQLAQKSFIKNGINRVILATDGDFNVGTTNIDSLKELIANKAKLGIGLTTLGFGQGNYNDYLMEQLANIGNGNYAYIDNINEARKVLVDQLSSTMKIIAKDVKIQVEFNPDQVAQYRLIGYENRQLKREDFNNDKIDAGDIGAGHNVTAIYELTLVNAKNKQIDPLRYQKKRNDTRQSSELAMIKLRYKQPNSDTSQLITNIITQDLLNKTPSNDFKFATAVAAFGQKLTGGKYLAKYDYQDIIKLANVVKGTDNFGYRSEFIQLVRSAQHLKPQQIAIKEPIMAPKLRVE
ncbi:MAG: VWA domain-containing protein [Gammaproteobacteria bacterium]|nr:VWA domain-containing protein [Gammaproteobacteria bacterium]